MENCFVLIDRLLKQEKRFVVARIVRLIGSAPRSQGTKCIILEDGSLLGSIGGGLLEHQVEKQAVEVLKHGKSSVCHFSLKGKDLTKTEMLCGGNAEVYLEPFIPENEAAVEVFDRIVRMIRSGQTGILFTLVSEEIEPDNESRWMLLSEKGTQTGKIPISKDKLPELSSIQESRLVEVQKGGPQVFVEPVEPDAVVFIFGGGHVSKNLARIAKIVGFAVVVIDDREDLANKKRFQGADEIKVLPFNRAFDHIKVTNASYIVILTRDHMSDIAVLKGALQQTSPAYIGMIASSRKRDFIYQALIDEGFSRKRLEQVHSPIGLSIGAETPEEIAVSIMAELIKTKAERYLS